MTDDLIESSEIAPPSQNKSDMLAARIWSAPKRKRSGGDGADRYTDIVVKYDLERANHHNVRPSEALAYTKQYLESILQKMGMTPGEDGVSEISPSVEGRGSVVFVDVPYRKPAVGESSHDPAWDELVKRYQDAQKQALNEIGEPAVHDHMGKEIAGLHTGREVAKVGQRIKVDIGNLPPPRGLR